MENNPHEKPALLTPEEIVAAQHCSFNCGGDGCLMQPYLRAAQMTTLDIEFRFSTENTPEQLATLNEHSDALLSLCGIYAHMTPQSESR
jgi:hypothetical protein